MITVWLSSTRDARELARHAVAHTLCCAESDVELSREPGGRPVVAGVAGLHIAISHTEGAAAVAVTRAGPVGVDVEAMRELPAAGLARHWFAPEEAQWVAQRPQDFLYLWTQKESVGKALGVGLRGGGLRRLMPLPPATSTMSPVSTLPSMAVMSLCRNGFVVGLACDSVQASGGFECVLGW